MTQFEEAALRYLVWHWRASKAQAAFSPITEANQSPDIRNPWSHINVLARDAMMAASDANLWPDDVPLADFPKGGEE